MWQFLDGNEVTEEQAAIVSLMYMANLDPSINDLYDLLLGWMVYRDDAHSKWQKVKD